MHRYVWIVSLCLMILGSMTPMPTNADQMRDRPGITMVQSRSSPVVRAEPPKGLTDAEVASLKKWGSIAFIVLASSTILLFILGCGSRVVVFADPSDALMSASMFIAPVVTVLSGALVVWLIPPVDRPGATIWEAVRENPAMAFVLAVGALWWLWSILGTVASSIRHNGFVVGLIVAVLKIGAVFSLLLIWWGILSNYDRSDSFEDVTSKFFLLAILAWFGSKFLNGERVANRRNKIAEQEHVTAPV